MHEDLIVSAMPQAKAVAIKYRGLLDPDEAVGIAWLTLVQIAPRFDPARGVKFTTFASRRIIGALQDRQREKDGVTYAPRRAHVEHFQILEGVATCRLSHADYRRLRSAVAELPADQRRVIMAYVTHSTFRGSHSSPSETPQKILGMKAVTFNWQRTRILGRLRLALEARGVRKVSDIL
jgi:RNA polymerase sigma factor (sigma-70 family)